MGWWSICLSLTTNPRLPIRKRGGSPKSGQPAKKDEKRCNLQGLHRFAVFRQTASRLNEKSKAPELFVHRRSGFAVPFAYRPSFSASCQCGKFGRQCRSSAECRCARWVAAVSSPYALCAAPLYRLMLPASPTMLLLPVEKTSIARLLLFCG